MPKFTEHQDAGLRYAEAGAGHPLLVLAQHGEPAPAPALDLLAASRRVIVVDLPDGTGRDAALAVAVLATTLGLDGFDVLGSQPAGCAAACWLAVTAPERVAALILQAPAAPPEDLAAALAETTVPALILHGTRDDAPAAQAPVAQGPIAQATVAQATAYQSLMPNAFFSYVYDAGADIQADRPEAFAGLAADFLTRHGRFLVTE